MIVKIRTRMSLAAKKYLLALRDALNRKHPLTQKLLPTTQAAKWSKVFKSPLEGRQQNTLVDFIDSIDLHITRPFSNIASDVDISAALLPSINSILVELSDAAGLRIFVFSNASGWMQFRPNRFKTRILKPAKHGRIEIAIVDAGGALMHRYSITVWKEREGVAIAGGENAPVKRMLTDKNLHHLIERKTPYRAEEIDAVYTWVNSSDPAWQELIKLHSKDAIDRDRYANSDELKYSIRSLNLFAPWVRTIYVFSNCAPPEWFVESDRYRWIYHADVMAEDHLPTFNSHAIETYIHQLPGLSEKFLYLNDDFFLSDFVTPQDFFSVYGETVARLEPYGIVPYLEQLAEAERVEEWQCAAVNGAKLLDEFSAIMPTQMHRHAPYAFSRTLFEDMLKQFPVQTETTRAARFRSKDDVSFASFLYHHYARLKGACVESNETSMIVRQTNYANFEKRKMYRSLRFFCINDGGGSSSHSEYNHFKKRILRNLFPFRSGCEK